MRHSPKHRCPYCPHFTDEETDGGGTLGRFSGPWSPAGQGRAGVLPDSQRPGGGHPGDRRVPRSRRVCQGSQNGRPELPEKLGNLQAGDRPLPAQPRGDQPRERGHTASTAVPRASSTLAEVCCASPPNSDVLGRPSWTPTYTLLSAKAAGAGLERSRTRPWAATHSPGHRPEAPPASAK